MTTGRENLRPFQRGAFGARHWHTRATSARHRIRHGIRHTVARAGRRPYPCVAETQSVFCVAPRRDGAGVRPTDHRRDGRQKTGWTKPQRYPSMGIRSSEPTVGCGRAARAGVVDATRTRLLTRVLAAVKEARVDVERCAVMTNPESRGDARCRPGRRRAASARRDTGDRRATTVRSGRDSDPDSRWRKVRLIGRPLMRPPGGRN